MRKFKLINDSGYIGLVQGEVYEGSYIHLNTDISVISCFNEYPEDWEEVFEPKSLWISVKDRLPNSSLDDCLVYIKGKSKIGRYDNSRDLWIFSAVYYVYTKDGVTHWMPLPDTPKQ